MEITLKVLTGRNAGQVVKVPVTKFLIGRSDDCHLRPHSDLISRHHCAILIDNGTVAVRDFNSRNGTFVNGERVVGQTSLKTGDKLSVGQLVFEVHASHADPMQRRPKVKDVRDAAARIAAPNGPDEDTDVSQWLLGDTSGAIHMDTKASDLTRTVAGTADTVEDLFGQADSTPGDGKVAPVSAAKASDSKVAAAAKKGPGKLPPVPAAVTKDSREAAAEMLKKILRNR